MSDYAVKPKAAKIDRTALLNQFGEDASWQDTMKNALTIARRELRDSFRDWRIIIPIFLLTLVFPSLANVGTQAFFNVLDQYGGNAERITESFLPLMPMIVGFFPVSISLVIALESFVGEKERRSLEPLLSTPLTNLELYIGKVLAAVIPPLMASYLGMTIYLSAMILGPRQWRPDLEIIIQIVVLTTIQSIVMVTGAVVISSQTTSTRAANLLASIVILPVSLLTIMESVILIQPHLRYTLWYVALSMIIVVILLIRMGVRLFNREQLLGRAIDELNLKWMGRTLWSQFIGVDIDKIAEFRAEHPRLNLKRWYQRAVFPTIPTLRTPLRIVLGLMVVAFFLGWGIAMSSEVELAPDYTNASEYAEFRAARIEGNEFSLISQNIVLQNVRALVVSTALGAFTFGVIPLLILMVPFGAIGFVFGAFINGGNDPLPVLLAIAPHGLVEIPALALAWASALRIGAIITNPPRHMTVGEAWLRSISDAFKVGIALVLPMLIVSACIEVFVTPWILQWYLEIF